MFRKLIITAVFATALSACGYVDEYERHVSEWEPVYCYQSIGAAECYSEPRHADRLRLVNYYGPHPSRYDAPAPLAEPKFKAPEMVNYWVKDPEPVPRPMPHGDLADRPWLTVEGRAESENMQHLTALETSDVGTSALLKRIAVTDTRRPKLPEPDTEILY